ncbi:MAG: hypothetical protein BM557_06445 [Flavobacterium sp. MedPE-SWcel]|uniref:hypothetical protein n=1 Tax=uncultured Flavobacterium sp. TaxID=165435 RepID=UPI00091B9DFD|nr:hypothetical protein [uncultured Flavobacterium sp.]OIQ19339.1 MAG: hypothetical protein BM557_06445 [Flavobacterium sp. MedPE-SWcel]
MKKGYICFVFLFIVLNSYSQILQSEIDRVKTSASKDFIEKNIVGSWTFEKLTNSEKVQIVKQTVILDTIVATITIDRPSYLFNKNGRYKITRLDNTVDEGEWKYSEKDKMLYFFFDKPAYNIPIDKVSPELLKKLQDENMIIEFTKNAIEIHEITSERLVLIEYCNDGYYLIYYRKTT